MKITEYPSVTDLTDDNVFLLDGSNGTKKIAKPDLVYALFDSIPEMHKNIFREKNLGSTYTSAQKQDIYNGTFHDMWVGDYWEINGLKWRIVDFDYFGIGGDSGGESGQHHMVIMCDKIIQVVDHYCTNGTKPPYSQSNIYGAQGRDKYLNDRVPSTFKSNLYSHSEVICSGVGGHGEASSWNEATNIIQNPTAAQIFGIHAPFALTTDTQIPQHQSNGIQQFALMRMSRRFTTVDGQGSGISQNVGYALRDPCGFGNSSTAMFTRVLYDNFGTPMITIDYGDTKAGMRPYICVAGSL